MLNSLYENIKFVWKTRQFRFKAGKLSFEIKLKTLLI